MVKLPVTNRRQITLPKKVLLHLGIKPGEAIKLDLLPDGRAVLKPARTSGSINDFIGLLAGKSRKAITIDEMNKIAAAGWAGKK
jgi:AbrB family looped-hinge helix DNA binding protein